MRRWLSAQQQFLEIKDFLKNPRLYFEKDVPRARHIAGMFRNAILHLTRKPKRYRNFRISLGLYKYLFSGKTFNKHYCILLGGDRITKTSGIYVTLTREMTPDIEYID